MAKRANFGGKAGVYKSWDGKLTGPSAGEPAPPPNRNQTWGSVQKKQSGKLFTLDEVQDIVDKAVAAALADTDKPIKKVSEVIAETEPEEEFIVRGK